MIRITVTYTMTGVGKEDHDQDTHTRYTPRGALSRRKTIPISYLRKKEEQRESLKYQSKRRKYGVHLTAKGAMTYLVLRRR